MASTIQDLKDLCQQLFDQKKVVAEQKKLKTIEEKKLKDIEALIVACLDENKLKGFDSGFGKVTKVVKPYAKVTDPCALKEYLIKKDIYDDMVSFNATTMNSWYNEEYERAKEEMDLDFHIDGMEISSNKISLSVKGAK